MNTLFLNMPGGYEYMPYLALPMLKGYVEKKTNYNMNIKDLNIKFHKDIWRKERIKKIINEFGNQYMDTLNDVYNYTLANYLKENIENAYFSLKDEESYKNKDLIKKSVLTLKGVKELINRIDKIKCKTYETLKENVQGFKDTICGEWLENYFNKTELSQYDVVGFSVTYEKQMIPSLFFAKLIKEKYPNIKIIFGGNLMTFYMKEIMCEKSDYWEYMDFCIFYQGEMAIVDVLNNIEKNDNDNLINVAYFEDGIVKYNYGSKHFNNEYVVPNFEGFDLDDYPTPVAIIPMITSKGCYWGKCTYCAHYSGYGKGFIKFSKDEIWDSIVEMKNKYNIRYIYFVDEAMPFDIMMYISQKVKETKLDVKWFCECRIEKQLVVNKNIEKLKEGGCCFLINGIESGNEKVLNDMNKGIDLNFVEKYLECCSKSDIGVLGMFFSGFPTEGDNELNDTFLFIERNKNNLFMATVGVFVLERETEVYNNYRKYNIEYICDEGDYYNVNPDYYLNNLGLSTMNIRSNKLKQMLEKYKYLEYKMDNGLNRESMIFLYEKKGMGDEDNYSFKEISYELRIDCGKYKDWYACIDLEKSSMILEKRGR